MIHNLQFFPWKVLSSTDEKCSSYLKTTTSKSKLCAWAKAGLSNYWYYDVLIMEDVNSRQSMQWWRREFSDDVVGCFSCRSPSLRAPTLAKVTVVGPSLLLRTVRKCSILNISITVITLSVSFSSPGKFVLIGVVSYGSGCADTTPGIYARVQGFLPWIKSLIADGNQ